MHYHYEDVNDAFRSLIGGISSGRIETVSQPSRDGDVLMVQFPMVVTYHDPTRRVLINRERDCNPFFHVYEALWMLAGRNELEPLEYFVSTFGRFSDNGETLNGAYGYRWRSADGGMIEMETDIGVFSESQKVDQLGILIDHLKANPDSRRAVLQMWTVKDDLLKIGDPVAYSKDVCCNLSACFLVRSVAGEKYLDMTVFNRSNDIVWGMLGANVVHFSFLQEYLATAIGVRVGVYHQITNNAHVYSDRWEPEKYLRQYDEVGYEENLELIFEGNRIPLVSNLDTFDREVQLFVSRAYRPKVSLGDYSEPFLESVAKPMVMAFRAHKERDYRTAESWLSLIEDRPWQAASTDWIQTRKVNFMKKVNGG